MVALLAAGYFFLDAFVAANEFSRDPFSYAESVCPQPPNGVDSAERRACLRRFDAKTTDEVVGRSLLMGGLLLAFAIVGWSLGQDPTPEWTPPRDGGLP